MIVVLNNKSNLNKEEFISYINELNTINTTDTLILCPTYLNIANFNSNSILLGSQSVSSYDNGAYTGGVSAKDLFSYGVKYSIIGHSERREYQKESNEEIKEKLNRLLDNNITPILCVGESKLERDNNTYKSILEEELNILSNIDKEVIIAYEPIWSIGTGIIPTKEEIEEVITFIKEKYPNNKVLYGGSANLSNIDMLKTISIIDGYLLGGLSLKIDELKTFIDKLK